MTGLAWCWSHRKTGDSRPTKVTRTCSLAQLRRWLCRLLCFINSGMPSYKLRLMTSRLGTISRAPSWACLERLSPCSKAPLGGASGFYDWIFGGILTLPLLFRAGRRLSTHIAHCPCEDLLEEFLRFGVGEDWDRLTNVISSPCITRDAKTTQLDDADDVVRCCLILPFINLLGRWSRKSEKCSWCLGMKGSSWALDPAFRILYWFY